MSAPGRPLPHSLEAEEYLLSCCLIDSEELIPRCVGSGVNPASFYEPKCSSIFAKLLDMHARRVPISQDTLAEELRTEGKLRSDGTAELTYAYLTQVSSRIPTTAQASFFVERVASLAARRAKIRAAQIATEILYDESREIGDASAELGRVVGAATGRDYVMPWEDLMNFTGGNDRDCLMGNRYLGRGGGMVIVAPSGMGKSVLSVGLGACASLGRPFFGLRMVEMRVLYVQAEDDLGDVAEAVQGFVREYGLTSGDVAKMQQRLRIVRWNDAAGERFLARLRAEHSRHAFDLVIVNPLFSFCGCSVSEQADMSRFLRNGLNPILNDTGAACVIVHHTNKPPTDGKDRSDANTELRYSGSGSSELTNWARAYVALQPVKGAPEGVCKMVLAKRGTRAGIVDDSGRITTSVMIEHSKRGLCWVPSEYGGLDKDAGGKFKAKFDLTRALRMYDSARSWSDNELAIAMDQDVSRKTVGRWRQTITDTAA